MSKKWICLVACVFLLLWTERFRFGSQKHSGLMMTGEWAAQRSYPEKVMPQKGFYQAWEKFRKDAPEFIERGMSDNPWVSIGPTNQGGRTNALAIDTRDPKVVYAGSASGGLWRLTLKDDSGVNYSWEYIDTGFPVLGVNAIVVDKRDSDVLYIGTGEVYAYQSSMGSIHHRYFRGSYGIGILKSTDRGETWFKSLDWSYDQRNGVLVLKAHPENPDTLFAGTSEGLYKSTDAGESWENILPVLMAVDLVIFPESPDTLLVSCGNFATEGHGIYRSTNGGETWTQISGGLPAVWTGKTMLSASGTSPGMVFADVANNTMSLGLFKSTDYGSNWSKIGENNISGGQGWYSHYVRPNPANDQEIFLAGVPYGLSTDGGSSFDVVSWGYYLQDETVMHPDHHAFANHPTDPNIFYASHDGGVGRTTDGGRKFQNLNQGYVTTQFYPGFSCSPLDSNLAIGGLQDNGSAMYRGDPDWQINVLGGDGAYTAFDPVNIDIIYASSQRQSMRKTSNGGENWNQISPLFILGSHGDEITAFIAPYCLAESNLLYAATNYLYRSSDGGSSWTVTNNDQPLNGDVISALAVSKINTKIVFAATAPVSTDERRVEVFCSVNRGKDWENITYNLPNRYVVDLVVSPFNPKEVYAVLSGFGTSHFFKTTIDAGFWEDLGGGLPDVPSNACLIDPMDYKTIYVGNDLGVWVTTDCGGNWTSFNDGLPPAVLVYDLVLSETNDNIRLASHGNGVYERPKIPTEEVHPPVPREYTLHQNYPNPFNTQTMISFTLSTPGSVRVKVTNVRGQHVCSWSFPYCTGTTTQFIWDGKDEQGRSLASGIYFSILEVGESRAIKKMTLIR